MFVFSDVDVNMFMLLWLSVEMQNVTPNGRGCQPGFWLQTCIWSTFSFRGLSGGLSALPLACSLHLELFFQTERSKNYNLINCKFKLSLKKKDGSMVDKWGRQNVSVTTKETLGMSQWKV